MQRSGEDIRETIGRFETLDVSPLRLFACVKIEKGAVGWMRRASTAKRKSPSRRRPE